MLGFYLVALAGLLLAGCENTANFRLPQAAGPGSAVKLELHSTEGAPILEPGKAGEFDSVDVLNPSVVRGIDGRYWNLYSGFDGTSWHTGLAIAAEWRGPWIKAGRVLSPDPSSWEGDDYSAANGSAVMVDGEIWYWYQAGRVGGRQGPQIGLARSRDGRAWHREAGPVLRAGPYRSWDERGVADPYVIRVEGFYYLYYTGLDRAQRQQLGVARSRDGERWEKYAANPILELTSEAMEEGGLGEPAVFITGDSYWMLYTGRAWDEQRRIGLAKSADGVRWKRVPAWVFSGGEAWDRKVVCDPTVEVEADGTVRVWFGGGDSARPDERIHGRIGAATLLAR